MSSDATPSVPTLKLHDGHAIPQLGFGIWQVPAQTTAQHVRQVIDMGYRHIDGAYIYGNEVGMGEGVRSASVAREDLFVTSKVWNGDHGRDATRASVERSLASTGLDYLDLVLIHWPVPRQDRYVETWQTLIELRDAGLVRSIGVSNFNADHLERIIAETGVVPVLNQIEINPELQQPELRQKCRELGIVAQAWTPLGNARSFESAPIADAAKAHGKSPAQIILRWHVQLGHALLARSENATRQAENLSIFDFELTQEEMAQIATLDCAERTGPDPAVFDMGAAD